MNKHFTKIISIILCILLFHVSANAQRRMEKLGRGVVAVRTGTNSAFISWRLLGTEDPNTGFNLYKSENGNNAVKLNETVLTKGTNYTDTNLDYTVNNSYFVRTVNNGTEQTTPSDTFTLSSNNTIEPCVVVPLKQGSEIHLVSVGDLDGDGEYEFVIDRIDGTNNSEKVEAYKRDGTYLWTIDLGTDLNFDRYEPGPTVIDMGMWDGITVYDMDGDNKAEVLLKTAAGVTFGDGKKLTNNNPNTVFFSVIDGMTGAEKARTEIPNPYASKGSLGCSLGIGYLNGKTPSLVSFLKNRNDDGSFNRLMYAWSYDGDSLKMEWQTTMPFGTSYGNGSDGHNMRIVDLDGDGKDEVVHIGFALRGEDGSLMYNMGDHGIEHGDRWFIGKLDPYKKGLQGYGSQQYNSILDYYYDAATGRPYWVHYTSDGSVGDVGRASLGDVDPTQEGYETWEFHGLYNAPANKKLSSSYPYPNFRIWWDGDLLSENLNAGKIEKWHYENSTVSRELTTWNYESATGSARNAPMFYGDIMGDWREEIVMTSNDYSKLIIFTTTTPTDKRIYTLAQNPAYRNGMTIKGYLQSHMPDFYLGYGMTQPPIPPIQTAKCIWKGSVSNIWDKTTSNWTVKNATGKYTQGDDVMFDISGNPDTAIILNDTIAPSAIKAITPIDYIFSGEGTITGSTGLIKAGNGAMSLNCYTDYTDSTRVEEGTLYINDTLAKSPVIVYRGAGIGGNGVINQPVFLEKGSDVLPGAKGKTGTLSFKNDLAFPYKTSVYFDITDDSTNIKKPSDRIEIAGKLNIADNVTFVINNLNEEIKPGKYPLIIYSDTLEGTISKIKLSGLSGIKKYLTNSGDTVYLTVEGARGPANVIWNGTSDTWDLQTTSSWNLDGDPVTFVSNDTVTFDASGAENNNVKVIGTLPAGNIFVNTANCNYNFSGSGNIGGTGKLVKNGTGTLSLLTTNSFTGTTTVNAGTLEVSSIAAAGKNSSIGANTDVSSSALTLHNATLKYSGNNLSLTDKGMTLGGTSDTIDIKNADGTLIIEGIIAGTGNLVKTGDGVLNMRKSSNTFAGNTYINGGTLLFGDETANLGGVNKGKITLNGGTLTMYNDRYSYTNFNTEIIIPEGKTGTLNTDCRCNYNNKLTGRGTLNLYLAGNIDRSIFFGDWSGFTGTININGISGSSFRIANSHGYGKSVINLGNNVKMYHGGTGTSTGDASASTVVVGGLSGSSSSSLTGEKWIIGEANQSTTFNGKIEGYSLTKTGTGNLKLTNDNEYKGGTTVKAGTLEIANKSGSATGTGKVTVNQGATLRGNGIIEGNIEIENGASLAPGDSSNFSGMAIRSTLNLQSGSTLEAYTNPAPYSKQINLLYVSGSINIEGAALKIINNTSYSYSAGDKFQLFSCSNISGKFSSIIPLSPAENMVWDTSELYNKGVLAVTLADGINKTEVNGILFYPNPVKDILHIEYPGTILPTQVTVKNLSGQTVIIKTTSELHDIDFSAVPAGIYIVQISTEKGTLSRKIIKL